MLSTISIVLASMMLGATGTFAVVHKDDAAQRELLMRKADIYLRQAQVRAQKAEADLAEIKTLVEQGFVGEAEADESQQGD